MRSASAGGSANGVRGASGTAGAVASALLARRPEGRVSIAVEAEEAGAADGAAGSSGTAPCRARWPEPGPSTETPCGGTVSPSAARPDWAAPSAAVTTEPSVGLPPPVVTATDSSAGLGRPRRRPVPPPPAWAAWPPPESWAGISSCCGCSPCARRRPVGGAATGSSIATGLSRNASVEARRARRRPPPDVPGERCGCGGVCSGRASIAPCSGGATVPEPSPSGSSRTYALPLMPGTSCVCSTPPCARTIPRTIGSCTGSPPANGPRTSIRTTSPRCAAATTIVESTYPPPGISLALPVESTPATSATRCASAVASRPASTSASIGGACTANCARPGPISSMAPSTPAATTASSSTGIL